MVCIARKILYLYVSTYIIPMVRGDCMCRRRVHSCTLPGGYYHTNQHVNCYKKAAQHNIIILQQTKVKCVQSTVK